MSAPAKISLDQTTGADPAVRDDSAVFQLGAAMMVDDADDFLDEAEDYHAITPISRFAGSQHKVVPERVGVAVFNGGKVRHSPGVIRRVMAEVAMGHYDAVLVYNHLQHLTPGSLEFNENYVKLYLARLAKTREVVPRSFVLTAAGQAPANSAAWDTGRWEVKGWVDLVSQAGMWVALLVIGQVAVACYLAIFLGSMVGSPWPLAAGAIAAVYVTVDLTAYLLLRGQPLFKWLIPALWLGGATMAPAGAVYVAKTLLNLQGGAAGGAHYR